MKKKQTQGSDRVDKVSVMDRIDAADHFDDGMDDEICNFPDWNNFINGELQEKSWMNAGEAGAEVV